MTDYQSTTAIITGAASGLGAGMASKLLQLGACVNLIDIDQAGLEAFSIQHKQHRSQLHIHCVDVTQYNTLEACFRRIKEKHHTIDYLFNNAGVGGTLSLAEATQEHWQRIINLNLYGVINGMSAIYPIMQQQGHGHIINTSSISGLYPFPGQTLYNTTKYAVTGLTLSAQPELAAANIKIVLFCPGPVDTAIWLKPIIGSQAQITDTTLPEDTITVEEAINDLFHSLDTQATLIITPKRYKQLYEYYKKTGHM